MPRVVRPCEYCGEEVDPDLYGNYREVIGWVEVRKAGGAHGVSMGRETGRYLHGSCYRRQNEGISSDQQQLV